jgi:rhodanese-related sulfurtransferase
MLYDSLHQKLARLPDDALVYPTHGAGSLCGRNLSSDTVSTIGVQRRYNYALAPMSREAFISMVTADQPDAPRYFTYDAVLNTQERPTLEQALARQLRPLTLQELRDRVEQGGQLLDTREPVDFEGAHLRGSVNVGLGGNFSTWCGSLLDSEREILLIADPGSELEAATRLGRIGFDNVAGYLDGGMSSADDAPELVERIERITAGSLAEQLSGGTAPLLIDVRSPAEWERERIDGALNLPLSQLTARLGEVPLDQPLLTYCASGYRSAIAASVLKRAGFAEVSDLVGGTAAWQARSLSASATG